jgi:hypothetical protein
VTGGGAALGDGLLDVVDAVQDGADLGDELSEVDLADPGHGGQQPSLGVAEQAGTQGAVQVSDGAKQGAKQLDLSSDQPGQRLWHQAKWWGRGRAKPCQQLGGAVATTVGVAPAEGRQPCLTQPGGCLWGRVGLQEGQSDLRSQPGKDLLGTGPVGLQQRTELVAGRDLGLDVVLAQPDQGLKLPGGLVQRLQPPQPVAIGAQLVGQLVAVTRVGLGPGGAPAGRAAWKAVAWTGTTGWPAASSRSTTRPLDCSIATGSSSGRPERPSRTSASDNPASVGGGVQWSTTVPASSITVTSWAVLAQSHPTSINGAPLRSGRVARGSSPHRRCLIDGPLRGNFLKPVWARRSQGRHNSNWPSGGKTAGPSPDPRHEHNPTPSRVARRILHQQGSG